MDNWLQNVKQIKEYLYIDENDLLRDKCRDDAYLENLIQQGEKILSEYNGNNPYILILKLILASFILTSTMCNMRNLVLYT